MISASDNTMTFADKTNNMYRVSKDQYNTFINNSITYKKYKKSNSNIKKKINIRQGRQVSAPTHGHSPREQLFYNAERSQRKLPE